MAVPAPAIMNMVPNKSPNKPKPSKVYPEWARDKPIGILIIPKPVVIKFGFFSFRI